MLRPRSRALETVSSVPSFGSGDVGVCLGRSELHHDEIVPCPHWRVRFGERVRRVACCGLGHGTGRVVNGKRCKGRSDATRLLGEGNSSKGVSLRCGEGGSSCERPSGLWERGCAKRVEPHGWQRDATSP
jgi:hypothetical protein